MRRLSRAVIPRSSIGDSVNSIGGYERRPSMFVGNMLQDFERRMSRFDNSCFVRSFPFRSRCIQIYWFAATFAIIVLLYYDRRIPSSQHQLLNPQFQVTFKTGEGLRWLVQWTWAIGQARPWLPRGPSPKETTEDASAHPERSVLFAKKRIFTVSNGILNAQIEWQLLNGIWSAY